MKIKAGAFEDFSNKQDPETLMDLMMAFYKAIIKAEGPAAEMYSRTQVQLRLDILSHWYEVLKYDMNWSNPRIFDHLHLPLKAVLNNEDFDPHKYNGSVWKV